MALVYKATCTVNGKSYVGFTSMSLHRRRYKHEQDARLGKKSCPLFVAALQKHGCAAFEWEVLFEGMHADALAYETVAIWKHNTRGLGGYNLTEGGQSPDWTPESREKARLQSTGRKRSPEARAKSSAATRGRPKPPEEAARLRTLNVGRVLSEAHKQALFRNGAVNSPEHNAKISAGHRAVAGTLLEEARALMATGLSPAKVAQRLGFARSTGYRIKNGTHGY